MPICSRLRLEPKMMDNKKRWDPLPTHKGRNAIKKQASEVKEMAVKVAENQKAAFTYEARHKGGSAPLAQ